MLLKAVIMSINELFMWERANPTITCKDAIKKTTNRKIKLSLTFKISKHNVETVFTFHFCFFCKFA